jgi:hypothetical protein
VGKVVSRPEITKNAKEFFHEISQVKDRSSFLQSFDRLKFTEEKQKIYELFFSFLLKSEGVSPGSSEIFFDHVLSSKSRDKEYLPKVFSKKDLVPLLKTFCDKDHPIVKKAIDLSGLEGKILLSRSYNSEKDSCEIKRGSFFNSVAPAFKIKNSKFFDARVICIDGYIEKVSEVHHLLEKAHKAKEPCFVFLRGASEEVIHTLKTNFDRKTLIFIPVLVPYDLDGANMLNDVAVSSRTDVVSSLKGNLISSISYAELGRVDSVEINDQEAIIENSSSKKDLDLHISFLQKKAVASSSEAERQALEKRIKRLGLNKVVLSLRDDADFEKRSFSIDKALRAIKKSTDHGVIEYGEKIYPYSSVETGKLFSKKFLDVLEGIEKMII